MISRILNLINSSPFQELTTFYNEKTMFSALHVERSENRHSAFIAWWLDPTSEHGLGTAPLKLMLRLMASKDAGKHTFKNYFPNILAGGYELEVVEEFCLEKYVGDISNVKNKKDKMDIWSVLSIRTSRDEDKGLLFPLVIENKIYSNEGKGQTQRYFQAVQYFLDSYETDMQKQPGLIYLTPNPSKPSCDQFVNITYQELLTFVIEPLMSSVASDQQKFVESYVRNLGRPASDSRFGVLAVSAKEKKMLSDVYSIGGELIEAAMAALYPAKEVGKIIGDGALAKAESLNVDNDNMLLLTELWDANEEVFKAVIFNQYNRLSGKLTELFKTSNRDNTKYRVFYNDQEIFPGKRLSKTKAACAIFKAYLMENPGTSLSDLQSFFTPEKVNHYYLDRYYKDLFVPYRPDVIDEAGEIVLNRTAGIHKGTDALAKWDFHLDDDCRLKTDNGRQEVICVKWWRKPDFDRLLEAIRGCSFIKVESV